MRPLTDRAVLILTAVTTIVFAILGYRSSHGDWRQTALTVAILAPTLYLSMRVNQRLQRRFFHPRVPPPPPAPLEASTERPEHVQRRRQRRPTRGRRL